MSTVITSGGNHSGLKLLQLDGANEKKIQRRLDWSFDVLDASVSARARTMVEHDDAMCVSDLVPKVLDSEASEHAKVRVRKRMWGDTLVTNSASVIELMVVFYLDGNELHLSICSLVFMVVCRHDHYANSKTSASNCTKASSGIPSRRASKALHDVEAMAVQHCTIPQG